MIITLYSGDDENISMRLVSVANDGIKSPLDLTTRDLYLSIKKANTDKAIFEYTATKNDAVNGECFFTIKREDTSLLLKETESDREYVYFIRIKEPSMMHPSGYEIKTIKSGRLLVKDKVPS